MSHVPNSPFMHVKIENPKSIAGKRVKKSFIFLCCVREIKNIRLIIHKIVPRAEAASERGAHLQTCMIILKIETAIKSVRKIWILTNKSRIT